MFPNTQTLGDKCDLPSKQKIQILSGLLLDNSGNFVLSNIVLIISGFVVFTANRFYELDRDMQWFE